VLDVAVADVLRALAAEGGGAAPPALVPSKGYHFADAPSVEYEGKVPAELAERLVPLLNARMAQLIAADAPTERWTLRRGGADDDAQLARLLGEAGAAHYAEGKMVRVVSVGGGVCPCGGTHVDSAARLRGVTVSKVKTTKGTTKVSYSVAA
jgi:Ser-tRNA(Ala) deacylase AlaX